MRLGGLFLGNAVELGDGEKGAEESGPWQSLPRHRDEDQVQLDVDRSFIYYPDSKPYFSA